MRIPSGKTDQVIYFVAVDSTDLKTRETGLSSFTVYRSRNGGAATVYTTPTVAELSAANMPGVYSLLIDEDTTIAAGSDSEEYVVHITQAAMAPVTRSIELYRRDTTSGQTITVANGAADADLERIQGTVIDTPATAGILDVNVQNINNVVAATPGAAGGVLISGSNSGTTTFGALTVTGTTTFTGTTVHTGNVSMAAGINITQSSANTSALVVTGNGTGHGAVITSGSGATGDGMQITAASTNGDGLQLTKTGTGLDLQASSTALVLAKTTNITGFNDIAATAVVSAGAITTSGGAVTTVTNLTNAPTAGDLTATMKASVNTEVDTAIADARLDELLAADSDIDGAAPPVVGSVFHELLTKTAGSFTYDQTTDSLEALRDRGDAAWTTATGFATSGQATSIQADTDDIQARLPAALVGGRMDASVGAMAADVITAASLAADAGTEMATAVGALTLTELAAIPGASPALKDALALLYMALRNRRETTATADKIENDAGGTVGTAALSDDGTTFTKGEYA